MYHGEDEVEEHENGVTTLHSTLQLAISRSMQGKIFSCKYVYEEDIHPIESVLKFKEALEVQYRPEQLVMKNNGSQIIVEAIGKPLPSLKIKVSWLGEEKIIHPKIVDEGDTFKKGVLFMDTVIDYYEKQQKYNQELYKNAPPNRPEADSFGVVNTQLQPQVAMVTLIAQNSVNITELSKSVDRLIIVEKSVFDGFIKFFEQFDEPKKNAILGAVCGGILLTVILCSYHYFLFGFYFDFLLKNIRYPKNLHFCCCRSKKKPGQKQYSARQLPSNNFNISASNQRSNYHDRLVAQDVRSTDQSASYSTNTFEYKSGSKFKFLVTLKFNSFLYNIQNVINFFISLNSRANAKSVARRQEHHKQTLANEFEDDSFEDPQQALINQVQMPDDATLPPGYRTSLAENREVKNDYYTDNTVLM